MQADKPLVIITTFLRPQLLIKTVNSWLDNTDFDILVVEQTKGEIYKIDEQRLVMYPVAYDSGLSFSRNVGVEYAKYYGYRNVIIAADSISLTKNYDFNSIINTLDTVKDLGIIGFDLAGRIPWEVDMEIKNKSFYLTLPSRPKIHLNDINFTICDMIRNFFIAKTECLNEVKWDDNLRLAEHQDFFYRLKQTNWKVFHTNTIVGSYVSDKSNPEYKRLRNRCWTEFSKIVKEKYNLDQEVTYSPELQQMFNDWNKKHPKIT